MEKSHQAEELQKISSRCACEHGGMQTHENRTCQCDVPQGREQWLAVKLWEAVKWGGV